MKSIGVQKREEEERERERKVKSPSKVGEPEREVQDQVWGLRRWKIKLENSFDP